jgi:polyisoprenoid-binding protein YceI
MTNHAPTTAPRTAKPLAPARWRLHGGLSSATFSARGNWGLTPANGRLSNLSGTATVDRAGRLAGELVIPVSTLGSNNRRRDRHLKSADFLEVERYPEITFAAPELISAGNGHVVAATLTVRDRRIELTLPVHVAPAARDRVALTAETELDRDAIGLSHNPNGSR